MLISLTLQNFALAKQLTLDIKAGFTVVTGETGAGKSILIDALSACLGERADSATVRFGADKADVSASFSKPTAIDVVAWLNERELISSDDDELVLRRVINSEGRSKAWINGVPSSISDLRALGDMLLQLHSQHSQQELLKPDYARLWLDTAAGLQESAIHVAQAFKTWQQLKQQEQTLNTDTANRIQRIAILEETLEQLAPLATLNYNELEQEFDQLSHFESMMQAINGILSGLNDEDNNVVSQVISLHKLAENQHNRAPIFETLINHFASAQVELEEALATLQRYADDLVFDPEHFAYLDKTLADFHRLGKKYHAAPDALVAHFNQCQIELEQLSGLLDHDGLAKQVLAAFNNYQNIASQLEQQRNQAALKLAQTLADTVKTLALPDARFSFQFTPLTTPNAHGLSQIDLLFSANKGLPMQSLAKVASGGELSRITLVMNLMTAERITTPVLVFDEIDVGISGGTAEVVGRLLRQMGNKNKQAQVICITHQPQVAAQGDTHLLVEKIQSDPAASSIRELDEHGRIEVLAKMSGGVEINETTLQHARNLRQSVLSHP